MPARQHSEVSPQSVPRRGGWKRPSLPQLDPGSGCAGEAEEVLTFSDTMSMLKKWFQTKGQDIPNRDTSGKGSGLTGKLPLLYFLQHL